MIEYRLFFQRRSGGHAIVEWIASHFDKSGVLVNSLRPKVKWTRQPTKYWNVEYPFAGISDEKRLKLYEKGRLKIAHEFVITTFEDPLRYYHTLYQPKIQGIRSKEIIYVIVIRDIYNYTASRLKFNEKKLTHQPPGWYKENTLEWKQLMLNKAFSTLCIRVNYNYWLTKKSYRKKIGNELKLPNNNGRLNKTIHSFGGGSSFTGVREKADKKMLTSRWKMYIEEFGFTPRFQKILNDDELREINLSKFGWALNKKGELIT